MGSARFSKLDHWSRSKLKASLIVTTYQKPRHLRLVLTALGLQQGVDELLEIVVADDGSTDETAEVVERFAEASPFPVHFTTHRHEEFQVARCRNMGVAATSAPYLIFLDGDCLVASDFVQQHLRRARRGAVMFGDCYRLEKQDSARINLAAVRSGEYRDWVTAVEEDRLSKWRRRVWWNNLIGHTRKPRLLGNNIGVSRRDFERVNGFDENFCGWGGEDDDLGFRFKQAGLQLRSILPWCYTYHIWHARDASWTPNWLDGANVPYLLRDERPTRCLNGLVKLDPALADWLESSDDEDSTEEPLIIPFPSSEVERESLRRQRRAA